MVLRPLVIIHHPILRLNLRHLRLPFCCLLHLLCLCRLCHLLRLRDVLGLCHLCHLLRALLRTKPLGACPQHRCRRRIHRIRRIRCIRCCCRVLHHHILCLL